VLTENATHSSIMPLRALTTKIGSGATPRGGKESYQESGISLIRSMNVYDFHFDFKELAHINGAQARELANVTVQPKDILLNITGASVARCCMVPDRVLPARVNQHVAIVRMNPTLADPHFILYCINSPKYKKHLLTLAQGGATREALTKDTIGDFEISLPPLPTQRKIAAILSAYDDLIENNTRRIKVLEEMAQSLYREWFVHFRFPGHEGVRLVESELGLVPEGWEIKRLSTLVMTQYGYTESANEDVVGPKYVRGMDINKQSYIDWSAVPYCPISSEEHAKFKLAIGDVLVIRMADPGKVGIIEKDIDAVFASYLIRLHLKSPLLSPYYLFYFLLSYAYQGYITGASTGTTRKSASAGVISDVNIAVPPADIRKQFDEQVSALRSLLNNLLNQTTNLRRTRDLLLPKLISGEVNVEAALERANYGIRV
jgi:type I restriction enzyme, S subunit